MARSDLSAPMEVITVLLRKDTTAQAHISEIRQVEMESRSRKSLECIRNPMSGLGEDLFSQISSQHTLWLFATAGICDAESFRCLKNCKNRRWENE